MIDKYLKTKYVKGGRGPVDMDCWGLVRAVRTEMFKRPLLPSFDGISPDDKRRLTLACESVRLDNKFAPVNPRTGAIATAWTARLCVHVGIVVKADGRIWVLETDEATGPCLTPIPAFESRYARVIYYDN